MIYPTPEAFMAAPNKRITLMGMSNVGKTTLARKLPCNRWFHYSVDYRIATAHLRSAITDVLKKEMMVTPYLARHLREDAIGIDLKVTLSNLSMISNYLGKVGAADRGGLGYAEFCTRQMNHRRAEIRAMHDVQEFIDRAQQVYDYPHFLMDASGSLCEIIDVDDPNDPVLAALVQQTLIVYIRADDHHEKMLVETAQSHPKPLYYRSDFLNARMVDYLALQGLSDRDSVDPDHFVSWIFTHLLAERRPRYEQIAAYGCTVEATELGDVCCEQDFLHLVRDAIGKQTNENGRLSIPIRRAC